MRSQKLNFVVFIELTRALLIVPETSMIYLTIGSDQSYFCVHCNNEKNLHRTILVRLTQAISPHSSAHHTHRHHEHITCIGTNGEGTHRETKKIVFVFIMLYLYIIFIVIDHRHYNHNHNVHHNAYRLRSHYLHHV